MKGPVKYGYPAIDNLAWEIVELTNQRNVSVSLAMESLDRAKSFINANTPVCAIRPTGKENAEE